MNERHSTTTNVEHVHDLTAAMRSRVAETLEIIVEEELEAALGAVRHERTKSREGYRNGSLTRRVVTGMGAVDLRVPRARLRTENGSKEWRSSVLPRYQRRSAEVDEAILGCYLAGANTRRIRRALSPLLGEECLSKSAVSRVVQRLKEHFEQWKQRDLSEETYLILYLDALRLPVRLARRVVKVPVLAVLGVREDGQKVLLSLDLAGSESTASWTTLVQDLVRRGLKAPAIVVIDGNGGLGNAVRDTWPKTSIQRCTKHKLENLISKAPKHCHGELKRDYRMIVYATNKEKADKAYAAFCRKWKKLVPSVVKSLEEAGAQLLTFMDFPRSQWKCLRTTNPIERLNGEFRRRTKTQGSFRTETAALILLFGLIVSGQIALRKMDGWKQLPQLLDRLEQAA